MVNRLAMRTHLRFGIAMAAIGSLFAAGCRAAATPEPAHLVERSRVAMGSQLRLTAWTSHEAMAVSGFDAIFAEFDRLESLMSVWRDGSDVIRLNAAAGDHAVPVSAETRAVLTAAHEVSEWTHGKFDVTFGALSDLWKFDHDQDNTDSRSGGDSRAAAAHRLSIRDGGRPSRHGVHYSTRRTRSPGRHRQGLRDRSRHRHAARGKGSTTS